MTAAIDDRHEWLEADGLGGFASGTTSGIRMRRYHALLLTATTPPTGRVVLVNGFDAWLDTNAGTFALSAQRYSPGVIYPDGVNRIVSFGCDPWPAWELETPDGTRVRQEIVVVHGQATTVVRWEVVRTGGPVTLRVRPFMSGRDYHSMHHENSGFNFQPHVVDGVVAFEPYPGIPRVVCLSNGDYRHQPDWYRNFLYSVERERGLDDVEDLASPGEFVWRLDGAASHACWILQAGRNTALEPHSRRRVEELTEAALSVERTRRGGFPTALDRAADAYLVTRGTGRTIVAGYPWFTDWGRDTLISLRGLCLATGRLRDARDILLEWSAAVSAGMLPNRFTDRGEEPEFNSVDASLWYIVAVDEFLRIADTQPGLVTLAQRAVLENAVCEIVEGYATGTRYGIRLDSDGLLAAGAPGLQLTWMDARVGDRVITPRVGKPVEIQALWLNAACAAARSSPRWLDVFERGRAAFITRFWNEATGHLADVVDVDHRAGTHDDTFRPNQILAVGGLPIALVDGERARRIVDAVEARLVTPMGLRSLARGEPGYAGRYEGSPPDRDAVYHQGTVWPWLLGPFVDAWVRVRGNTVEAQREARERFVAPLLAHLEEAGLGHVSEIADAEPPFTPRGCPFQAWSLGELIRLERSILVAPVALAGPVTSRFSGHPTR
jgi:predicted glycogen debranching enzyme